VLVVPESLWTDFLRQTIASALYVENWVLAADSVDYLAASAPPSAVQHYWSLSVEEQFYLVMPLLVLGVSAAAIARRRSWRRWVGVAVGTVVLASFGYSIWLTATSAPVAFFSTGTRAWEFGVGALLAFVPDLTHRVVRPVLAWTGLALIAVSALAFSSSTAFPGYAAALPVLATAAVILARDVAGRWSVAGWGARRATSFLGRTSYAVYLWHWPLIVLLPFATGAALTNTTKAGVLVATLVLGGLSTRWVEEPVRFSPRLLGGTRAPRVVGASALAGMAVVVTCAAWGLRAVESRQAGYERMAADVLALGSPCLGAQVRTSDDGACPDPRLDGVLVPAPAMAAEDTGNAPDCWSDVEDPEFRFCSVGPATGFTKRLFAVGDSHNNALLAAYTAMAEARGWRIDVAGHAGCYWTAAEQVKATTSQTEACASWVAGVDDHLRQGPAYDAVLTTYREAGRGVAVPAGTDVHDVIVDGLRDAWAPVVAGGTPVIAISDVPVARDDIVTCVERHGPAAATACASPRAVALAAFDGLAPAVAATPGASLVDQTELYCDPAVCLPVIGNVVVYRDRQHITDTFARTLAPFLGDAVDDRLDG
jgi:peptidoglycan/LPS O-acetylase OafA/YrhL